MSRSLLFAILLIAGCAPLPPTPQDIQAKKFEILADKAAIYIVRSDPDFNRVQATLVLDDAARITTYAGTYYRWEVAPGPHRIAGFASDSSFITLNAAPGKIYFVRQRLAPWSISPLSLLNVVGEQEGRTEVMRAEMVKGY
jgi:hypothetical protein